MESPSAILVQPDTGDVVYAREAFRRRPMASTAKMMTALVAIDRAPLDRRFRAVRYEADPAESLAGLKAGERVSNADLLKALMVASANDAAATLATGIAGSSGRFTKLMNRRAAAAGLTSTRFANPVGLDAPGAYSTARDLARLAQLVRRNSYLRRIVDRPRATISAGGRKVRLSNSNALVGQVPWISGVKTGHTLRAGYLLAASGERRGVPLVSVVMAAPSPAVRDRDTIGLMRYGFARYRAVTAARRGRPVTSIPVSLQGTAVPVAAAGTLRVAARRGEKVTVVRRGLPAEVSGPLPGGTRVGEVVATRRGRVSGRVPLVTARAVAAPTPWQRLTGSPALMAALATVLLALAAAATLVASRRRRSGGPVRRRGPA